jgi:myo-inositol catabolism protein IolC
MSDVGYTKPLYILPFDHKSSFVSKLFGWDYDTLTPDQKAKVSQTRQITYEGFQKAVAMGIPKETAAILTDEEFGGDVLKKAKEEGFVTLLTTEKSGQEIFTFEYGTEFAAHIQNFAPTFTKALIRYNPGGDSDTNKKQLENLKPLVEYSHANGYKFLIEPLLPPTDAQLQSVNGDKAAYDTQMRPGLTVQMMQELQSFGIEPDIWKIEGFSQKESYEQAVAQARKDGRDNVGVVILGRGGTMQDVEVWFNAGAPVGGVVGFAVGRTIFWDPLEKWHKTEISSDEAAELIGKNFYHFYEIFAQHKS